MAFEPVNRWPAQNYGRFMAWTIAPVDAQNVLLVICDTVLGRRSKVILKGVWEGHLQTLHFCGLFLIVRHAYPQFPNVLSTFDLSALTVPPKGNDVQELQPNHQLNLDSLAEGGASVWKYSIHVISNTFVAAIGRSSGTQTNGSPIPLNITACIFSVQLSGALIPYGTVPFNAIADGYYNGQTDGVHYENMTVDSSQDIHFAWTGKEGEVCWGIISSQKEADTLRLDYRYDWHLSKDYPENSSSASACALSRRTARVVSKTADEVALFVDIHDFPNRAVVAR
ncbi:hypothetical protein DL96DRAFT_1588905 [Flagelloscypha sp. PMI_526]|nr:hypothetical protein DL96DRAFT_1588905 [Flagelloscypha sp. PMI_526]